MRPLLVGMNNPLSRHPDDALYPEPPGCTGHRIWRLLAPMTQEEYLERYDRTNLVEGLAWSSERARLNSGRILDLMPGRRTIILGAETQAALGYRKLERMAWHPCARGKFLLMPHPSGRNTWFNDPRNRALAAHYLREALDHV